MRQVAARAEGASGASPRRRREEGRRHESGHRRRSRTRTRRASASARRRAWAAATRRGRAAGKAPKATERAGNGNGAVNADTPCGVAEFLPTDPPRYVNGTAYERVRATRHVSRRPHGERRLSVPVDLSQRRADRSVVADEPEEGRFRRRAAAPAARRGHVGLPAARAVHPQPHRCRTVTRTSSTARKAAVERDPRRGRRAQPRARRSRDRPLRACRAPPCRCAIRASAGRSSCAICFPKRGAIARALGGVRVDVARRVPHDADVIWFPWNGTFLRTAAPVVATVHDAAPFAFPAADPRRRATEQNPFLATAKRARTILVQSRFTAGEVERRLGVEPDRIVVTPLAADAAFTTGTAGDAPAALRGRRYVLHVGAHDERKNSATLIDGVRARVSGRRRRAGVHAQAAGAAGRRRRRRRAGRRRARGAVPRGRARRGSLDVRGLRPAAARGDGVRCTGAGGARRRAAGGRRRCGGVGRRRARRGRVGGRAARAARRRRGARPARRARPRACGDVLVGSLRRATRSRCSRRPRDRREGAAGRPSQPRRARRRRRRRRARRGRRAARARAPRRTWSPRRHRTRTGTTSRTCSGSSIRTSRARRCRRCARAGRRSCSRRSGGIARRTS